MDFILQEWSMGDGQKNWLMQSYNKSGD